MTITVVSFVVFLIYLLSIFSIFRSVPKSLSDTFYMISPSPWKHLFTIMMFFCALTIMPPLLEITDSSYQFLAFFCPAAIAFVGAAPNFHDSNEGKVHTYSAYVSAASGLIWVILATPFWYIIPACLTLFLLCGLLTKTLKSSITFWMEMVAFFSVYSALIASYLFC